MAVKTSAARIWVRKGGFDYDQSRLYGDRWDHEESEPRHQVLAQLRMDQFMLAAMNKPSPEELLSRHTKLLAKNNIEPKIISLSFHPSLDELKKAWNPSASRGSERGGF